MHDFFFTSFSMDDCHCSFIKFHKKSTATWGESQVVHSLAPRKKTSQECWHSWQWQIYITGPVPEYRIIVSTLINIKLLGSHLGYLLLGHTSRAWSHDSQAIIIMGTWESATGTHKFHLVKKGYKSSGIKKDPKTI